MPFSAKSIPIIGGLSTFAQIAAVSVVVGVLSFGAGYIKGGGDERRNARISQLEQSLKANGVRSEIETDVDALNAYNLCIELGGMHGDCTATVRRMEADQPPE